MSIDIRHLSFSYGPLLALQDINLTLQEGRFNALLGPNGAGKSTLFALLTRLYALQSGEITIAGHSIARHPAQVMRKLGVVFQQSTLDLDLTVAQNLYYHAALHGMSKRQAQPRITEELARFDLSERRQEKVRNLNGGHRRRVEIARALLHKPSILLLDEPSVGLDPATRESLNQHIRQLCEAEQLTALWATHLMEEIQNDDPVSILFKGRMLASDRASELCQQYQCADISSVFRSLTGVTP
ncbi:ABC transporter ATP-binding protein [Amphritea sp. 2_MG-2023]|jgi:ABC-2 type transport system ATP-binding protein|uniref:ABC transporter ATP-binding protein n=1 Tax=Amphritea TaxID=515417 RepID=UPI001C07EA7B|nr:MULTISPECIES: ABC transporter ATP-binding protein [Amphritea]MBU2965460.1 ATP-binding cassette domain-containing protein [Amphritea atlantica]MDO6418616.1 ABC transporter ATP-binding protein [Amphritea sp. 2_MG-2023]MDX2423096.1 ABC transporter ATP-binding protein [Amphritea sp.]